MAGFLFTSESVGIGHPDKICDQISDAILDAYLKEDPDARVACETLVSSGLVVLAGEITSNIHIDYATVTREMIHEIGYDDANLGFDYRACGIIIAIHKQSEDIARGVDQSLNLFKEQGAGDQGLMFGYASNETEEMMPMPISLAHKIVQELHKRRTNNTLYFLRPDAKTQVTVEYDNDNLPVRVHTVVLSTQHTPEIEHEEVVREMKKLILETIPEKLLDDQTKYFINPTGRFVIGGPQGDCGLTGRKTAVDTYGGMAHHGGGAYSGKDPTKVDRSGSYGARYVAKNIVAADLAKRCEIQVSYAIGVPYPISIRVNTLGTGKVSEEKLEKMIPKAFDLSPGGLIQMLDLKRPIYKKTAFSGHFGRNDPDFTWEKTDKTEEIYKYL